MSSTVKTQNSIASSVSGSSILSPPDGVKPRPGASRKGNSAKRWTNETRQSGHNARRPLDKNAGRKNNETRQNGRPIDNDVSRKGMRR